MNGWTGKVLKINLTDRAVSVITPEPALYQSYIGGKGLGGHYLDEFVTRPYDDPEMPLLFFTGPLVGTSAPTSGRMTVMSRSPLTGTIADASVGGNMGTWLKKAGWDGIIITGRSAQWCGIEIDDEKVNLSDAGSLQGLEISEIDRRLAGRDLGACAVIGPAAENGVRFAAIMFDGHYTAGRGGLGLVCAAKKLRYLTVKGSGPVTVADPAGLKKAQEDIFRLAAGSPAIMGAMGITNYGTAALYDLTDSRRMMPTSNFRATHFDQAKTTNAHAYQVRYSPRKHGCRGCHILCKKTGSRGEVLPEFETMNHFGALLDNSDIGIIVEANRICNQLGMDTISAGSTISCHAEIIGRKLKGPEILSLLDDIGRGRGLGTELGMGSWEYASSKGRAEASMSVKKLELPAYDPRGAYGMALAYAVSTRGGCHLRAYPVGNEILRKPVPTDRFSFSGKSRIIKIAEDANAVIDSLTACKFIFFAATLEEYSKAFSAVTGLESSGQDLLKTGERIYYHERIMNARNGFSRAEDTLPARFFTEPGSSGNNITVAPINRGDFEQALDNYYTVRGLDRQGLPTGEKASELGLLWNG